MSLRKSLVSFLDRTTRATTTIDYAHQEIHAGSHFKGGYQSTALDTDDTIEILFVTPDSLVWSHWTLTSHSTGACTIQVFEGATTSSDGTLTTTRNRNRNSVNTATTLLYHTPTVTDDGTKLVEQWIGGTGFRTSISGDFRGNSEIMLKQNTKYLVRLTADDDAIKGAIGGDWYEHISVE